jgi:hypothetical protein
MLVRLLTAVCLFASLFLSESVASAFPKRRAVSLSQCAVVFERFGQIRPPADSKAASRALRDTRWLSRAAVWQQTVLAGWTPIKHDLGPPGGVYVVDLSPSTSSNIAGYRIYFHTTRVLSGGAAAGVRGFFAGRAAQDILIDEYALCYPDRRILCVDQKSRRMSPPL